MTSGDAETDQFRMLMRLLQEEGVAAFPDSGTLLFLHRDGLIPARDKDIDLAVLPDAIPTLLSMSPRFAGAGYRVKINRYRGLVYTVALKPRTEAAGPLPVAIHVYFPEEDCLVSPQVRQSRPFLGRTSSVKHPKDPSAPRQQNRGLRRQLKSVFRRLTDPIDRAVLVEYWPFKRFFEGSVWRIPADLLLPMTDREYGGVTVHAPRDPEGYLAARYGDWRAPRPNWAFWRDDGLITAQSPRELVERLRNNTADG